MTYTTKEWHTLTAFQWGKKLTVFHQSCWCRFYREKNPGATVYQYVCLGFSLCVSCVYIQLSLFRRTPHRLTPSLLLSLPPSYTQALSVSLSLLTRTRKHASKIITWRILHSIISATSKKCWWRLLLVLLLLRSLLLPHLHRCLQQQQLV